MSPTILTVLAYIDPISGSIILQAAAAVALATVFSAKQYWVRIRAAARSLATRIARR